MSPAHSVSGANMRLILLTALAFVCVALSQESSSTPFESATTTAAEYATSGVTYNSNTSPSPINTAFSYDTQSSNGVQGNATISTSGRISGNATSTSLSSTLGGTLLSGTVRSSSSIVNGTVPGTAASTSSAPQATNTVPCNGYPEFCDRKYSNITQVAAHNSPFVVPRNLASNQALDVTYQLNDGIRMLQFQVHYVNNTLYLCHTSCNLLNAGTLVNYLITVREWLEHNRYDVVTILMGNYDAVAPGNFTQPVIDAGILEYVYTPPTVPMARDGWPTLGEMILTNKRIVMMLDYEADQAQIPWLLDEFSYMWETPFSPVDRAFPCTADRPPNAGQEVYDERMNLANHNLNVDITLAGISLLIPAFNLLNETNADIGYGSAGWAVANCSREWKRAPNFLLVDYYNIGNFNGSVFAVAAAANNVSYDRNSCCGIVNRNGGSRTGAMTELYVVFVAALSAAGFLVVM